MGALIDWIEGGPQKRARAAKKKAEGDAAAAEAARLQQEMALQAQMLQLQQQALSQRSFAQEAALGAAKAAETKRVWVPALAIGGAVLVAWLVARRR